MKFAHISLLFVIDARFKLANAATCGGGVVGDGACPQDNLCCSQSGWCSTKCCDEKQKFIRGSVLSGSNVPVVSMIKCR